MKKIYLYLVCLLTVVRYTKALMTEAQLKNAVKLVRNVCQPKVKISDQLIEKMHKGEFVENEKVMSYLECVLRTGKLTKNGKVDNDAALSQIPNLPLERQQPTREAGEQCKEKGQDDDKYKAAFNYAKCLYFANPENYFLP